MLEMASLRGQELRILPPPDFNQDAIRVPAERVAAAWAKWSDSDRDLDRRVFRLPMSDARDVLRRSLGAWEEFLAARSAYVESVAAYIRTGQAAGRGRQPGVSAQALSQDRIRTLGVSLGALHNRLAGLRDSPEWLTVRRGARKATDDALKLQAALREPPPVEVPGAKPPVDAASEPVYRESEGQLAGTLRGLWTAYYQAMADAVEQKPGGSAPLTPVGSSTREDRAELATSSGSALDGVWTYAEGSQHFNGVAEPLRVILELWMENGVLVGRYRAELPAADGVRKIDVRLRGAGSGRGSQTMAIESQDSKASGQIVLEGPGPEGRDLMLVRVVPERSRLPRGRELLHRRPPS